MANNEQKRIAAELLGKKIQALKTAGIEVADDAKAKDVDALMAEHGVKLTPETAQERTAAIGAQYPWAANKAKLERAIKTVKGKAKADPSVEVSEETIKTEYESYGGLVLPTKEDE